jgi:deoxyribonuclease-4
MPRAAPRFGPAGIPHAAKERTTIGGIKACAQLGLSAMELEFVRGIRLKVSAAKEAGEIAKKLDISLSCHGPYWINACSPIRSKIEIAIRSLLETMRIGEAAGCRIAVFHPGYYQRQPPEIALKRCRKTLQTVLDRAKAHGIKNILLGPETTGKQTTFGTLEECVHLAQELGCALTVDFAHLYCRSFESTPKTKQDYAKIFDYIERQLGGKAARYLHCHFTGVHCEKGNEKYHLPVAKDVPPFKPLAQVIVEQGYSPVIIAESKELDRDALYMQRIVQHLMRK